MEAPKTIHPLELKEQLDRGEDIFLMDVREAWEHSLASIPGSEHVPLNEVADRVQEYIYEENIVVYCHHGERSYRAALILIESGFPNVSISPAASTPGRRSPTLPFRATVPAAESRFRTRRSKRVCAP